RNALVWVNGEGQVDPAVPELRAYSPYMLALSPDGQRLAVTVDGDDHRTSIWIYFLRERRWQQLIVHGDCRYPVWSPAGDRLAFTSNRDGPFNIYVLPVDREGAAERLTNTPNQQWSESWSPDGRFFAYQEQDSNASGDSPANNTWILPLDGHTKPWMLERGALVPAFSPDGRWLAY